MSRKTLVSVIVAALYFAPALASAQWTAPTSTPPSANVLSPLNVSSTGQTKVGGLVLNTGGATNGLIVQSGLVGISSTTPFATLSVTTPDGVTGAATPPAALIVQGGAGLNSVNGSLISLTAGNGGSSSAAGSGGNISLSAGAGGFGSFGGFGGSVYIVGGAAGAGAAGNVVLGSTVAGILQGKVGIGSTTPFSKLSVTGAGTGTGRGLSVANSSNLDTFFVQDNGNSYHSGKVGIGVAASGTYNLEVNGSIGAVSFFYTSDRSLKDNIQPLSDSLEKIKKLQGVSFSWKKDGRKDLGLIAQDVEKVYPDAVATNPTNGLKSVEYGNLVAPLIEAVKAQQKEIDDLKAEVKALQAR